MDTGFNRHQFIKELEDSENSPENSGGDSPAMSADNKITSTSSSSSKRSRSAKQKRVVTVPIRDVEGLRMMTTPPPSDSWAWRKYGQKPIKGSPYPRGYYRCSSSKGCPARKQMERSRLDPTILSVTYYSDHNHNSPTSQTTHHKAAARKIKTPISYEEEEEVEEDDDEDEVEEKAMNILSHDQMSLPENKFSSNAGEAPPLIHNGEFGFFGDFDSTCFTMLWESPMLTEDRISTDSEMAMIFAVGEEEELFADLGELPECSAVFRRGLSPVEAEQRSVGLATTS